MELKENDTVDQQVSNNKPEYDRKAELQAFDDTKAGVKGLVDSGVNILPRIFVNEDYMNDQKSFIDESKLTPPVIDLAAHTKIVEEIGRAAQEWGFFQIVNHGIPHATMERMLDGVRAFHEMDTELKRVYYTRDARKKFVYNSSFDLFQARYANWRDTITLLMAPNPPDPQELPHVCRYKLFLFFHLFLFRAILVLAMERDGHIC